MKRREALSAVTNATTGFVVRLAGLVLSAPPLIGQGELLAGGDVSVGLKVAGESGRAKEPSVRIQRGRDAAYLDEETAERERIERESVRPHEAAKGEVAGVVVVHPEEANGPLGWYACELMLQFVLSVLGDLSTVGDE